MGRIADLCPELWGDERFMALTCQAKLFYIGYSNFADARGVHPRSPRKLAESIWPGEMLSDEKLAAIVAEVEAQHLLEIYKASDGKQYWVAPEWHSQRAARPVGKFPAPPPEISERRHLDVGRADFEPIPQIMVPLKEADGEYEIPVEYIKKWRKEYRDLDVIAELRALREWNVRNPAKRKNRYGVEEHIDNWLQRAEKRRQEQLLRSSPFSVRQSVRPIGRSGSGVTPMAPEPRERSATRSKQKAPLRSRLRPQSESDE